MFNEQDFERLARLTMEKQSKILTDAELAEALESLPSNVEGLSAGGVPGKHMARSLLDLIGSASTGFRKVPHPVESMVSAISAVPALSSDSRKAIREAFTARATKALNLDKVPANIINTAYDVEASSAVPYYNDAASSVVSSATPPADTSWLGKLKAKFNMPKGSVRSSAPWWSTGNKKELQSAFDKALEDIFKSKKPYNKGIPREALMKLLAGGKFTPLEEALKTMRGSLLVTPSAGTPLIGRLNQALARLSATKGGSPGGMSGETLAKELQDMMHLYAPTTTSAGMKGLAVRGFGRMMPYAPWLATGPLYQFGKSFNR